MNHIWAAARLARQCLVGAVGAVAAAALGLCAPSPALADDAQAPATSASNDTASPTSAAPDITQTWAIHGQATFTEQAALPFHSPYAGPQSLSPDAGRETFDATFAAGFHIWRGAEFWLNPEIDQGFGLDDTFGVAGFPSGEAYKVGKSTPYFRMPRLFLRQTIDLGGGDAKVSPDMNQLGGVQTANRIVITIGKFSVPDIFDGNAYAHDPRSDFLNWTVVDTGTFDYAADAWAYTYGAAVEWYEGSWTTRFGLFDMSIVPNSADLDPGFGQFQYVGEIEKRYSVAGHDGRVLVTGFLTRGRMGSFAEALQFAQETGQPPNVFDVRRYQSKGGVGLSVEQSVTDDLGVFLRAGAADGDVQPYEFTDVDQTVAGGVSITGKRWGRENDAVGVAAVVNEISKIHQAYLADGGLGILVGDGKLPHPGPEAIVETYYKVAIMANLALSFDAQLIANPGYNRDRGPAPVLAARLHAQF